MVNMCVCARARLLGSCFCAACLPVLARPRLCSRPRKQQGTWGEVQECVRAHVCVVNLHTCAPLPVPPSPLLPLPAAVQPWRCALAARQPGAPAAQCTHGPTPPAAPPAHGPHTHGLCMRRCIWKKVSHACASVFARGCVCARCVCNYTGGHTCKPVLLAFAMEQARKTLRNTDGAGDRETGKGRSHLLVHGATCSCTYPRRRAHTYTVPDGHKTRLPAIFILHQQPAIPAYTGLCHLPSLSTPPYQCTCGPLMRAAHPRKHT